jgi:predicted transcriptional regulator
MRKSKTLFIQFEPWQSFRKRVEKSVRIKAPSIQDPHTLKFDSVANFQSFLTAQKIAILATISSKSPTSIYQLAKLVERDFANVQRDCVALQNMGFIKLVTSKQSKKKTRKPVLVFEYDRILVQMSNVRYYHELHVAA